MQDLVIRPVTQPSHIGILHILRRDSHPLHSGATTNMGHKVSVVHGVKSDDFFKSGNAINEIWLGRLEIISRLPFGDSDLGQAGWRSGGFPKIPWHNFIIPLKRRAEQSVGEGVDKVTMQLSLPVVILLSVVVVACALPMVVRRRTPSSCERIPCETDLRKRDNGLGGNGYAVRACIATISLAMGLVVLAPLVMDARGSGLGYASGSTMVFVLVVIGVMVILAIRAVFTLWMDWRRICRRDDDRGDDVEASSALMDENLPLVFLSVLQRQRLA